MLAEQDTSVNLVLEQISLGRGKHWYDPVEKRGHNVQTISIDIWHVTETDRDELPKSSYGQFHSDDVYIVRWRYKLQPLALGQTSVSKPDIGRDRVAYWIWQGINASPNERGISALMAVCVNEEKGPHVSNVIWTRRRTSTISSRSTFFKSMKKPPFFNCSMELSPFIKANGINRRRRNPPGISTCFWEKSTLKHTGGNSPCTASIYAVEPRFYSFISWRISCYSGTGAEPPISRRCWPGDQQWNYATSSFTFSTHVQWHSACRCFSDVQKNFISTVIAKRWNFMRCKRAMKQNSFGKRSTNAIMNGSTIRC